MSVTYTATAVDIDGAFGPIPALVENERRWNGFAYAWFPVSSMDCIVEACAVVADPSLWPFVVRRDGVFFESDDDGTYNALFLRLIDGVPHFSFGGGWCWFEVSDDCAACAVMSPDDRESVAWQCGGCGVEFAHGDGVHGVQYGIYHEFTCHDCADGGAV